MRKIGFVGIGNIGAPMARSVARAGFDLTVCDQNAAALKGFADAGHGVTDRPAALASCEAVVFMVSNDQQLLEAALGEAGLVAGLGDAKPALVIVMSTVLPATVAAIAAELNRHGVPVVDAPVSGGPLPAEKGELTIMAGGEADDLERARPILAAMGTNIHICGPLGSGELTKIVNNLVGVTNQFLVAEALRLARTAGLDLAHLTKVMDQSSGRNFWSRDWELTQRQYDEYASDLPKLDVFSKRSVKDFRLALDLAADAGAPMPLLDAVTKTVAAMSGQEIYDCFHAFTGR